MPINVDRSCFFVDGVSDKEAIKQKFLKEYSCCPRFSLAKCNGKDVSASGYVSAIKPILDFELRKNTGLIVCVLDLEKRKIGAVDFGRKIIDEIVRQFSGKYDEPFLREVIRVFVADIMFENWIVADVDGIKVRGELVREDAAQECFEGKSGSTSLGRLMKVRYGKTEHASVLFKAVSFDVASENSKSFRLFKEELLDSINVLPMV